MLKTCLAWQLTRAHCMLKHGCCHNWGKPVLPRTYGDSYVPVILLQDGTSLSEAALKPESPIRGQALPLGQHKVFPSPLTEEQALICMGWQYARPPLLQMNPPDSWETFLKGSPAKGHEGEWPQALLLCNTSSPPRLSAEQACCEFPPHPGSICMQILPHLFLLPSERTNLV